jgi:hypothetical protein
MLSFHAAPFLVFLRHNSLCRQVLARPTIPVSTGLWTSCLWHSIQWTLGWAANALTTLPPIVYFSLLDLLHIAIFLQCSRLNLDNIDIRVLIASASFTIGFQLSLTNPRKSEKLCVFVRYVMSITLGVGDDRTCVWTHVCTSERDGLK